MATITTNAALPSAQSPLVEANGAPTRPMFQWMLSTQRRLDSQDNQNGGTQPSGDWLPTSTNVIGLNSISSFGSLASGNVQLQLAGDVPFATATQYYGSDSTGAKGWYNVSAALGDTTNIKRVIDGTTQITSFDLTDVTLTSGGTLQRYGFDAKGRLSEQEAATTDNLPEGTTNLYYTDARAKRVVIFPVVTGEVPPVLVYLEDGSLVYTEPFA